MRNDFEHKQWYWRNDEHITENNDLLGKTISNQWFTQNSEISIFFFNKYSVRYYDYRYLRKKLSEKSYYILFWRCSIVYISSYLFIINGCNRRITVMKYKDTFYKTMFLFTCYGGLMLINCVEIYNSSGK